MKNKWTVHLIAAGDGWTESQGTAAALFLETEMQWSPLKVGYNTDKFFPKILQRIAISDNNGNSFLLVPGRKDKKKFKLAAMTRSMQQIADLDPGEFNSSSKAVSMAKTALLIK